MLKLLIQLTLIATCIVYSSQDRIDCNDCLCPFYSDCKENYHILRANLAKGRCCDVCVKDDSPDASDDDDDDSSESDDSHSYSRSDSSEPRGYYNNRRQMCKPNCNSVDCGKGVPDCPNGYEILETDQSVCRCCPTCIKKEKHPRNQERRGCGCGR